MSALSTALSIERALRDREAQQLRDEINRLALALAYAKNGFALAFDAATKHLNDEVLLHCGHHEAMCAKALEAKP